MEGFDYGNARLRAVRSRLLNRRDLEALTETGSLNGLLAALIRTPYRKAVEAALARVTGMDCLNLALRDDLVSAFGGLTHYYDGTAREEVLIVLRGYDIHNLKTVLRGLAHNARPAEILAALLPVGELKSSLLAELAPALDPRAAVDLLASLSSPFARPLLRLRAEHPGADVARMELALEQWQYQEATLWLENQSDRDEILALALQRQADQTNLLTVLRFAHAPNERRLLGEWLQVEDVRLLLVGPGLVPFDTLVRAGQQDHLAAAVDVLAGTPYEQALRLGLQMAAASGRLSDLEAALRRDHLQWLAARIPADPLGIGVVLGCCALKVNEINNLRRIACGIQQGLAPLTIRAGLEFFP